MPASRIEAFLSIEQGLAAKLNRAWVDYANKVVHAVGLALDDEDYTTAYELAGALSMAEVVAKNKEAIRYYTYAALFHGAGRLQENLKQSVVSSGALDPFVSKVGANLVQQILGPALELAQDSLVQTIAEAEQLDPTTPFGPSERGALEVVVTKLARLARPLTSFRKEGSKQLQLVSALHTSRVSAYGFTAEAQATEVDVYAINEQLDNRICPVCTVMHGKTFAVNDATEALEEILLVDNPESLKILQPWPKQDKKSVALLAEMSPDELVTRNWHIPPFHPYCRGLLVHVGRVPRVQDTPSFIEAFPDETAEAPVDIEVVLSDFEGYDPDIKPSGVEMWNRYLNITPEDFYTKALGIDSKEWGENRASYLFSDDPAFPANYELSAYDNLVDLGGGEPIRTTGITLDHFARLEGGRETAHIRTLFDIGNDQLYFSWMALGEGDQGKGLIKPVMAGHVAMAQRLGLSQMTLKAGASGGGYAWAKYGFTPVLNEWQTDLIPRLRNRLNTTFAGKLSKETLAAVEAALNSPDPKALWVLADLKEKVDGVEFGKAFLRGSTWVGNLNLDDGEALNRFSAYLGV